MIKVSVLIVTYNAEWEKLESTVRSVVFQNYDDYEIVFSDDGSSKKWDKEIEKLLDALEFKNYKIKNSEENVGTVKNIYNGLSVAEGEFIKVISPGDFFYDRDTLKCWIDYMENQNAEMSFGDSVYYRKENSIIQQIATKPAPANIEVFKGRKMRKNIFVNYMLANDTILGASILVRRDVMEKYLKCMVDKVKYAEDYMVRLMVYENKKIVYYPYKSIWYEYGIGISTTKESKWAVLLKKDFDSSNQLLLEKEAVDKLSVKYKKYLRKDIKNNTIRKLVKEMMFPSLIYWRIRMNRNTRKTPVDGKLEFINEIENR